MLEHLDRTEARIFLAECRRVLHPEGLLRLVVPDLRIRVDNYLASGDADQMISNTHLGHSRPKTWSERFRYMVVGERQHMWMYDGPSLARLVTSAGFSEPTILKPGDTTIHDPGSLDLYERAEESVYVEARRPKD